MAEYKLTYNPLKEKVTYEYNGKEQPLKCIGTGKNSRLQVWVNDFFLELMDRHNWGEGDECTLAFYGTKEDFEVLNSARENFKRGNPGIGVSLTYNGTQEEVVIMKRTYEEWKEEVLRCYKEYLQFRKENNDNVDSETLENKRRNIENGKFMIIIAGEAKSGKSTFINAFLGVEILPMDVKQCTSALIEINHGSEVTLKATYTDGREETIVGKEKVGVFLKKHGAMDDKYRKIPVTTINNEILIKSKGNVRESEIDDLIKGVKEDNVYNLSPGDYEKFIRDYISDKKGTWAEIVTKMEITCPIPVKELQKFTLIDSPGVNAAGKVGDVTNDYIGKADAIFFIKPLTGQALESSSFRNFLDSNMTSRSKAARLMLFTRKSDEPQWKEVVDTFSDMHQKSIARDRIAAVDSKLQLFFHTCSKLDANQIGEHFKSIKGTEADFPSARALWFEDAEKDTQKFLALLEKESNFREINGMIESFAYKAHYVQLADFLTMMCDGYQTMLKSLEEKIDLLQKSAEDPGKLKDEIGKKKDEIEEVKLKMHKGIRDIENEYQDKQNGIITKRADEAFKDFELALSSAKGFDETEKKTLEGQDLFVDFQEKLYSELITACNRRLTEMTTKTSFSAETVMPRLSTDDFQKLKKDAEKYAMKEETYIVEHCCSNEIKTRSVYSKEKHIETVKRQILGHLKITQKKMVASLINEVTSITTKYKEKLQENMNKKIDEYDDLQRRMTKAEKITEEKRKLESIFSAINPSSEHLQKVKGDIEYVIG